MSVCLSLLRDKVGDKRTALDFLFGVFFLVKHLTEFMCVSALVFSHTFICVCNFLMLHVITDVVVNQGHLLRWPFIT